MSNILIKGMEIEENCVNCPARHGAECWASHCARIPDYHKSRPSWCPLVPVPPHGDLVDRDEIIEAGKSHPTYKNSKIVKAVVDKACCLLKTATVVIPANKEGE